VTGNHFVTISVQMQFNVPCTKAEAKKYSEEGEQSPRLEERLKKVRSHLEDVVNKKYNDIPDSCYVDIQDATYEE
jgi:hypothetical protein